MNKKEKPLNSKTKDSPETSMTLLQAEQYLRKIGEWSDVAQLDREIIINWATFLKKKES